MFWHIILKNVEACTRNRICISSSKPQFLVVDFQTRSILCFVKPMCLLYLCYSSSSSVSLILPRPAVCPLWLSLSLSLDAIKINSASSFPCPVVLSAVKWVKHYVCDRTGKELDPWRLQWAVFAKLNDFTL